MGGISDPLLDLVLSEDKCADGSVAECAKLPTWYSPSPSPPTPSSCSRVKEQFAALSFGEVGVWSITVAEPQCGAQKSGVQSRTDRR